MPRTEVPLGHLATPDGRDSDRAAGAASGQTAGAVLLLPDVFGLSDLYRGMAGRLAAEGFVTLALELWGAPVTVRDPGAFLRAQSDPEVLARIRAGVDLLAAQDGVGRIGVLGFCIGGTYALLSAAEDHGLAACVCFYGILSYEHGLLHDPAGRDPARKPRDPLSAVAGLRCPALGIFGGRDTFVPEADVRTLIERAREAGRSLEVQRYPEAGHAFLNTGRPEAYRPDDAHDAFGRAVAFLRRELSAAAR